MMSFFRVVFVTSATFVCLLGCASEADAGGLLQRLFRGHKRCATSCPPSACQTTAVCPTPSPCGEPQAVCGVEPSVAAPCVAPTPCDPCCGWRCYRTYLSDLCGCSRKHEPGSELWHKCRRWAYAKYLACRVKCGLPVPTGSQEAMRTAIAAEFGCACPEDACLDCCEGLTDPGEIYDCQTDCYYRCTIDPDSLQAPSIPIDSSPEPAPAIQD